MATEVITIPQSAPTRTDMNWDLLRTEGISILQQLAGQIWTDYNTHDPGVTILEALCYAITDLGYRTEFEMEDLLTVDPNVVTDPDDPALASNLRNFITMAQVAIMCPLTPLDYRKFLIDCEGVRNGWLQKADAQEEEIGIDEAGERLVLSPDPAFNGAPQLDLNGLYEVLLEFEEDPRFGDLNSNALSMTVELPVSLVPYKVVMEFQMPCWEEVPAAFDLIDFNDAGFAISMTGFTNIDNDPFSHAMVFTLSDPSNSADLPVQVRILEGKEQFNNLSDYLAGIQAWLNDSNNSKPVFLELQEKRTHTKTLLNEVSTKLCDNRNLCEDFFDVRPMDIQEIGLCLEVEVAPETDCDRVLAEVNYQMQRFLSPTIRFYNLPEMFEKGYTSDEIFNGPLLQHGFIDSAELRLYQRRTKIYTSDLVQLFMDIDGVKAINKLCLSNYVKGNAIGQNALDCLILTAPSKFLPRLSMRHSDIRFDKGDKVPTEANANRADLLLNELKALDSLRRGAAQDMDLPVPRGTYLPLHEYASIQEEFPLVYGIGSEGLDSEADDLRRAKALQLKGFLSLFEQLLANYLSQLANIRRIFALEGSSRTYFTQTLDNVPGINDLLANGGSYAATLQGLVEDGELFESRRNRFLDHLIARFNESFTDYALWVYSRKGDQAPNILIGDKEAFLTDYPSASNERAKAYNYCDETDPGAIWGSDNVSGLKKRVSLLLGFGSYTRDQIAKGQDEFETYQSTLWYFRLKQGGLFTLIESTNGYATEAEAEVGICETIEASANPDNIEIVPDGGSFKFQVLDKNGDPIAGFSGFASESVAQLAVDSYVNYLNTLVGAETFHILENILLRPMAPSYQTLPIFLDPNCNDKQIVNTWAKTRIAGAEPAQYDLSNYFAYQLGEPISATSLCDDCECLEVRDPYSFRIKVIAPVWTDRFRDAAFRALFRKTVREATPAHIFVEFLFIDFKEMVGFEKCYEAWLYHKSTTLHLPSSPDLAPNCMASQFDQLCSRYEAYYELAADKKITEYIQGEVLAYIVDQDGKAVHAAEGTDPSNLPAGLALNELSGEIIVTNPALLTPNSSFTIQVGVWNSSGEKHCLEFSHTFKTCVDTGVDLNEPQIPSSYTPGDVIFEITHPSESFTISPDLTQPGALPQGLELNGSNQVVIANPNTLLAGKYRIVFATVTSPGGCVTEHTVDIKFPNNQKAFTTPLVDCSINWDTLVVGTPLFNVRDYDGGVKVTASLPEVSWDGGTWASIGLGLAVGSEIEGASGVIEVVDPAVFQNTLKASATLVEDCYQYTVDLTVKDENGGVTNLPHVIHIMKDTEAVYTQDTVQNYFKYENETVIGRVSDDKNLGIDSWSAVTDLSGIGLRMEDGISPSSGLKVVNIVVDNRDLFWKMVPSAFTLDPNTGNLVYSFLIDTVDLTGGISAGPFEIQVMDNPGNTHTPSSLVDIDQVGQDHLVGEIKVDGGGSVTAFVPTQESEMQQRGLAAELVPDSTDPAKMVGSIYVSDPVQFQRSLVSDLWTYDAANNKFTTDMGFRVDNSETGYRYETIALEVGSNLSNPILPYNNMRISDYYQGAQLLVTQEAATAITGSLPAGTTTNTNATTGLTEIIVDGISSMKEGTWTVTINGADFDLIVQKPQYVYRREVAGDPHIGYDQTDDLLTGMVLDGYQEHQFPSLGNIVSMTLDGSTYTMVSYNVTNRFFNSNTEISGDFDGIVNTTDPVSIRMEYRPIPRLYKPLVDAILVEETDILVNAPELESLLQSTADFLGELDSEIFPFGTPDFGGDTELQTLYNTGEKDQFFTEGLRPLVHQALADTAEILQTILSASGAARNEAQDKYLVYSRLLRALAFVTFDFAGTIRENDLDEGSLLEQLVAKLSSYITDFSR